MNYNNFICNKKLVFASVVLALTACGGDGGSEVNTAPSLDATLVQDLTVGLTTPQMKPWGQGEFDPTYADIPGLYPMIPAYRPPTTSAMAETGMQCVFEALDSDVPILVCDLYESAMWASGLTERRRAPEVTGDTDSNAIYQDGGNPRQFPIFTPSFEVDLLQGVVDPDFADGLSIENLTYVPTQQNCAAIRNNPPRLEEYADLCGDESNIEGLIDMLPPEAQVLFDAIDDLDVTPEEKTQLKLDLWRLGQSNTLPRFANTGAVYGFDLTRFGVKVTPKDYVPILREGEFASIDLQYEVSDGTDSLSRRALIRIHGESYAPQEDIPYVESGSESIVETDIFSLVDGMSDQDIEIEEALTYELGALEDIYNISDTSRDYIPQAMNIRAFTQIDGAGEPVEVTEPDARIRGWAVFDAEGTEIAMPRAEGDDRVPQGIQFYPAAFAPTLEEGETEELRFSYDVFDISELNFGQATARIIEYTVIGETTVSPPSFPSPSFGKSVGGASADFSFGDVATIDLLEDAADAQGDPITVVNFDDSGAGDVYGIDVSMAAVDGTITIDTAPFWAIAPGATREFTFTYNLSDGNQESVERTLTVTLTGEDPSLLVELGGTTGFEGEALGGAADTWRTRFPATAASIVDGSADSVVPYAGTSMLRLDNVWSTASTRDGLIPSGTITEGQTYYISYWMYTTNPDGQGVASGISPTNWGGALPDQLFVPVAAANEWVEYVSYLTAANNDPLSLWLHNANPDPADATTKVAFFDDVRLVEYQYDAADDFASDSGAQNFEAGNAGVWTTANGTVTVAAAAAAGGSTNGLMVDTAGQADAFELTLPGSAIPDGAIQQGGRYRVAFNMQFPAHAAPADDTTVAVTFYDTASPGTTYSQDVVLNTPDWKWMDYNMNLPEGTDWANTDVGIMITFDNADAVFHIDDVTVYQLP